MQAKEPRPNPFSPADYECVDSGNDSAECDDARTKKSLLGGKAPFGTISEDATKRSLNRADLLAIQAELKLIEEKLEKIDSFEEWKQLNTGFDSSVVNWADALNAMRLQIDFLQIQLKLALTGDAAAKTTMSVAKVGGVVLSKDPKKLSILVREAIERVWDSINGAHEPQFKFEIEIFPHGINIQGIEIATGTVFDYPDEFVP
jgi:hypothetical protein